MEHRGQERQEQVAVLGRGEQDLEDDVELGVEALGHGGGGRVPRGRMREQNRLVALARHAGLSAAGERVRGDRGVLPPQALSDEA
jgi:hypothetical protein